MSSLAKPQQSLKAGVTRNGKLSQAKNRLRQVSGICPRKLLMHLALRSTQPQLKQSVKVRQQANSL